MKRSSFSFFENEQTRPGFLSLCVASVCTGINVLPVSNFAQQLPTTRKNMQQAVQKTKTCNIQQFWELLANNAKMASIVKKVFTDNLCIYILGVNSSNGGITNPKCGDGYSVAQNQGASFFCRPSLYGRYVTIRRHDERTIALNFCEVEVYSARRGTEPSTISVSSSFFFFFNPKKTKILWANLCLHFCFINIWLSLFDEANEIKSLIKRP